MSDNLNDIPNPRCCHILKRQDFNGFGFNLHSEKSKIGQYIGKVDENSPSESAGLREGDKIIEVNGVNIANETHRQVVSRIKEIPNETKLLVVDEETNEWYKERKISICGTLPNVIYVRSKEPQFCDDTISSQNSNLSHLNDQSSPDVQEFVINVETEPGEYSMNQIIKVSLSETKNLNSSVNNPEEKMPQSFDVFNSSPEPGSLKLDDNGSLTGSTASVPESPINSINSQPDIGKITIEQNYKSSSFSNNNINFLNLNMTVSEMKEHLASRKKSDPKKFQMNWKQKYDIMQQL